MALRNDGIRPNAHELWARTGCGFVFGALAVGLSIVRWFQPAAAGTTALCVLSGGLVCALLARHHGDRFWSSVKWW